MSAGDVAILVVAVLAMFLGSYYVWLSAIHEEARRNEAHKVKRIVKETVRPPKSLIRRKRRRDDCN